MTSSSIATATVGVLLLTAAAGIVWWLWHRGQHDRARAAAGVGAVLAVALWWALYPWSWEYHSWHLVNGVVATTDSRLVPVGGHFQAVFAVQLRGEPGVAHAVYDDRGGAIRQGDQLELRCVRVWQSGGSGADRCEIVSLRGLDQQGAS